MVRRRMTKALAVLAIVGLVFIIVKWWPERRYRAAETRQLVSEVSLALHALVRKENRFLSTMPLDAADGKALNCWLMQALVARQYLSAQVLRAKGNIDADVAGQSCLVDAWGRTLVFQPYSVYPSGLVYPTAQGRNTVLPLSTDVWPPEKGEVQVWSLGPNGLDDRGGGDDVLP